MKMIFNYDANKTHFHNKGFALSLVLKVRFFGTRKWPIVLEIHKREDHREIKIHVYAKRQTSDSNWDFLIIENKQIKTVQNNSFVYNWRDYTYFLVQVINS